METIRTKCSAISYLHDHIHISISTHRIMPKQYKLAFSLHGHAADVRNVTAPSQQVPLLLSASRDGSAIVWGPSNASREWDVKLRVEGPEKRYVSCVGMTRWGGQGGSCQASRRSILTDSSLFARWIIFWHPCQLCLACNGFSRTHR